MADTENTLIVTNDSIAEVIKPDHVRALLWFSQVTGYSLSATLNRAVDLFLNIEAPSHIAPAPHGRRQNT
jgi:hypothetical protein